MSNKRRLPRPAKRAAALAVAAASVCGDCGAEAARPRRDRGEWVVDVPHADTCPSRVLPGLRDSLSREAVRKAQPAVGFPMAYLAGGEAGGVVIAGHEANLS